MSDGLVKIARGSSRIFRTLLGELLVAWQVLQRDGQDQSGTKKNE